MKLEVRDKERVDINAIIQDAVSLFDPEAIQKRIKINIQLNKKPVFVFGDKIQLQQVLLNLLYNAAHAMESNDPENRTVYITQLIDKGSVTLSVRDTGEGIEEELKENLFNPFVTSRKAGLGIGLAVSRTIIVNHEGEIWASNVTGGGAEFSFRLIIIANE
jgi:two-component system sensor kinase FixL